MTKQQKLERAAWLGKKIKFWNWIEELAQKVLDYSRKNQKNLHKEQCKLLEDCMVEKAGL
jgi:hypothetical protein